MMKSFTIKDIEDAIKSSADYMLSLQKPEGFWGVDKVEHREPPYYQKKIVLTAQAISVLVLSESKNLKAIQKGLRFCINEELNNNDVIDLWAWKSIALGFSNTKIARDKMAKVDNYILSKQDPKGFWPNYPITNNLSNKIVVSAFRNKIYDKSLKLIKSWFLNNKAKDGIGWGFNSLSNKSEITFTNNVLLALFILGLNPDNKDLRKILDFIFKKQRKDGGWPSSKMTISNKSTCYSTSLSLASLLCLRGECKETDRAIKFLLDMQNEDGGWPFVKGEESKIYVTYYVARTLSFYLYLKKMHRTSKIRFLKNYMSVSQINTFLFSEFDDAVIKDFRKSMFEAILNSRTLGVTKKAIDRRVNILRLLNERGDMDIAEIIDALKEFPEYSYLNKKSHMTQIKLDVEYLRDMNLLNVQDYRYYLIYNFFENN